MNSTATTDEILAAHPRWFYSRTDRNGTRYFYDYTCPRCGGRGGADAWVYTGWVCYECGGSGKTDRPQVMKVYTPEHEEKLKKQRQARFEKKEKERIEKAIRERGTNLEKAGFGNEDGTYVIYRVIGNTYEIKDELKGLGAKFNPAVGWFFSHPIDSYNVQRMEEKEVLTDSIWIEWKQKEEVKPLWAENQKIAEESPSKWVGEIGDRIELSLHIDRSFEGKFQLCEWKSVSSYMYLMHDADGNIYKWSTSCYYKEGDDIHVRGTIKDHAEFRGVKQTVLTRLREVK